MRLTDKIAIITGAGSGIGRASAYLFSKEGAKVIVADVNEAGGQETVTNIKAKAGDAIFVRTDISRAADAENLVKACKAQYGRIDILFNNAGLPSKYIPIEETEESYWERIFAVNMKGMFLVSKYAVPEMKKGGGGAIINTASMLGVKPGPLVLAYASSKGGVIAFTKGLALELAPYQIRVNCICPMLTTTPMMYETPEERRKKALNAAPLGRLATPEDMANTALFLASGESSMLTGSIIQVDGGGGI